jgi:hypothetical protein
METLSRVAGMAVVLLTLADVFFTVLFPGSGRGPVRRPLSAAISRVFRALAHRLGGRRRMSVLAYSGPTQILLTVAAWLVLLTVGWALIYFPALGEQIRNSSGPTDTGFPTALYFSGFSLATLGTGDVVANSNGYRLLSVVEAATGFAVITLVITYFLSIYSALPGRNAFAMKLHHRSLRTDDAAVVVAALVSDSPETVREHLEDTADFMRETTHTTRAYPVLRHFQYVDDYCSLPLMLLSALDTLALVGSTLDRDEYDGLPRTSALDEMSLAAEGLLHELVTGPGAGQPSEPTKEQWRRRQAEAADTMREQGVQAWSGDDAAEEYIRLRTKWDGHLAALAENMAHEWDGRLHCPPGLTPEPDAGT